MQGAELAGASARQGERAEQPPELKKWEKKEQIPPGDLPDRISQGEGRPKQVASRRRRHLNLGEKTL